MFGLDSTVVAGIFAIAGTLLGTILGSTLGLRRHHKETNWALRQQAYVDLVLSLQRMRDYYAMVCDDATGLTRHTEEYLGKRGLEYEEARGVFQKSRALAYVLLGPDVSDLLDKLETTIMSDVYDSHFDWADACYGAVDGVLTTIRDKVAEELSA